MSLGVERSAFADRAATVAAKKSGNSLMSLENAINAVGNFKSVELAKIVAAAGGSQSSTTATEGEPSSPSVPSVKLMKLNVASAAPLKDEAGVDAYLAGLKKQLMAEISSGASVIVQ